MKQAKVSELKARLSAYLAAVRGGDTVIVYDRKTPIARLIPFDEFGTDLKIEEPTHPLDRLKTLPLLRLHRRVDVLRLLRESRDQR